MISAAECRANANACLRRAQGAERAKLKATLLTMARTWTALAVQTERLEELLKEDNAET